MAKEIFGNYIKKDKLLFGSLILIIGIGIGIGGISPYVYGNIIDSITAGERYLFGKWILIYLAVLVCTQILAILESVAGNYMVNRIENSMKKELLENVLTLRCKEIEQYTEGELLNRLEFDAQRIVEYYLELLTSTLMIVLNLGISAWFILHISSQLSVIAFITIPVLYLINFLFYKKTHKINEQIKQFEDKYFAFLNNILADLKSVKAFQIERSIKEKYVDFLNENLHLQMKNTYLSSFVGIIRGVFGNGINILILFVAGMFIISGHMTVGNMVAFNSYLEKFFDAVSKAMELNLAKQGVMVNYERMEELKQETHEEKNKGEVLEQSINNIVFKGVFFGYGNDRVLRNLNYEIQGNGFYSIVGRNGCGKTTIFKLLERFYESDEGNIFINEKQIEEYTLTSLRGKIFYMAKEPFFLQDTIIENLRVGKEETSDAEIVMACKRVGIHNDIVQLPKGYRTIIEKNGKNFSSGQKQKLGIARAILSGASLFLLDEVTSDLDGAAEKKVCELIEELAKDAIVLNIAHKEESLKHSKKVLYIENGEIIAEGVHLQLIKQYKQYREMFENKV